MLFALCCSFRISFPPITFAPRPFLSFNYPKENPLRCALVGDAMVVGRTLWDFVIEVFRTPGMSVILLALLILFEIILILIILLVQNGLMDLKFSYGGLGLELHQFTALVA